MPALLSYADIIGMNYIPASAGIVLSAAEQTLAAQAVAIFGFAEMWSDYDDYADEIEALMASTLNALLDTTIPPRDDMSSELTLFPATATVINGNAIALIFNAAQRFGNWFQQNAPAINDRYQWTRFVSGGGWKFRITAVKRSSCGILTFTIKDVAETTVYYSATTDLYNATDIFNFIVTNTVTIPSSQEIVIIVSVAAKNGSASTYTIPISSIEMWRES